MKFSMMVTVICVIQLYSIIQMIKSIVENESDGKKVPYFFFEIKKFINNKKSSLYFQLDI